MAGNLRPRYEICIVNEKGKVQLGVWDTANDWQLIEDPKAYAGFLSLETSGDFYKVKVKDVEGRQSDQT